MKRGKDRFAALIFALIVTTAYSLIDAFIYTLNASASAPSAVLSFELPDGRAVPAHFHITEVGKVRKDFIDCGGTVRSMERCVLQVWVANDLAHRVEAGKLAKIIGLARPILGDTDMELEVEYDVGVITQMPVLSLKGSPDQITLRLGDKHTACLAPDRCGVPDSGCSVPGCCESTTDSSQPVALGVRR